MLINADDINSLPACGYPVTLPGFNHEEEVYVLGWRFKHFPNKSQKNIYDQIKSRQCYGEILKQVTNQYSFHAVNITKLSFKDPHGNVHYVSKFCYIQFYFQKIIKQQ